MSLPPIQGTEGMPSAPLPTAADAAAAAPAQNPWALNHSTGVFDRDKFFVNQKVLSMGNKYFVYDEAGSPICFVDRPIFKVKAIYGIYTDESKSREILSITQDSALQLINDSFTITDPATGQVIGFLKRRGWMSMLRRTWHIQDATGNDIAIAQEDSAWKAALRRIPYLNIIGAFFRTNFIISNPAGQPLGDFIRQFTVVDKHVLDMTKDPGRTLDRRIILALGVVLDNDERRHQNR